MCSNNVPKNESEFLQSPGATVGGTRGLEGKQLRNI